MHGTEVAGIDQPLNTSLAKQRTPAATAVFQLLTTFGSVAVLVPVVAAAAGLLAWRTGSRRPVWISILAIGGAQILVVAGKLVVGSQRPDIAFAAVQADGYSFPSGHSISSLVAFGVIAWLVSTLLATTRWMRTAVWVAAAVLTAGVGASRMYLGVHYLTDVLAAWALGTAWLVTVVDVRMTCRSIAPGSAGWSWCAGGRRRAPARGRPPPAGTGAPLRRRRRRGRRSWRGRAW